MKLAMIVAMDIRGGIGINNELPWHCPEDFAYFKGVTEGQTVVMGMNTYKSLPMFPKGLPNRNNLVICRDPEAYTDSIKGVTFVTQKQVEESDDKAWLIGGAKTYVELKDYIEMASITIIQGEYECDTYLPLGTFLYGKALVEQHELSERAEVYVYVKAAEAAAYQAIKQ